MCNKLLPTRSSSLASATVTTSTSFEMPSSHARVTSIKFRESVREWVSEWVSDKHSQWSDSGPIKKISIKKAFSHQDVKSSNSNSPFTSNQEVFNLHNRTVSLHDLLQLWNQSYKVRLLKKRDYGKNSGSLLIWFIKMLKTTGQTKSDFISIRIDLRV